MSGAFSGIVGILTIGAIGAILYTLVKNPTGVNAMFTGVDSLLKSSYGASLGKVA
jgi:hypothetical protein